MDTLILPKGHEATRDTRTDDGRMMDGWTDRQTDKQTDGQTNGRTDGWMDEWMY